MRLIATEEEEQTALFQWAALNEREHPELRLLYSHTNGGLRNVVVAKKLKAAGAKKGIPDIFLPIARHGYHGLYIELKRTEGGKLSEEQKQWIFALAEEGYAVRVCKGWTRAVDVILVYLLRVNKPDVRLEF